MYTLRTCTYTCDGLAYVSFWAHKHSFLLGIFPRVQFMGQRPRKGLALMVPASNFPKHSCQVLPHSQDDSATCPISAIVSLFNFSHCAGYSVISLWLYLAYSWWLMMLNPYPVVYWPLGNLLWSTYSSLLPVFKILFLIDLKSGMCPLSDMCTESDISQAEA